MERFGEGQLRLDQAYKLMAEGLEKFDFGGKTEHAQIEYMGHLSCTILHGR